jgi:hypothetical protein
MKLTRHWSTFKGPVQVVPVQQELPQGMTFGPLTFAPGKDEQKLSMIVPANVPPGTYNFVFKSFAPIPMGPKAKQANVVQCSSAVVVTVVPKQVATLSVASPATLKAGEEIEVQVKVARTYEQAGAFKLKVVFPKEVTGLEADEVTLPASQNEVKIVLRADEDATPGPRNNIAVEATCQLHGVTLTHVAKFNVNIGK